MKAKLRFVDSDEFLSLLFRTSDLGRFSTFREHRIFSHGELDCIVREDVKKKVEAAILLSIIFWGENSASFCICVPMQWDSGFFGREFAKLIFFNVANDFCPSFGFAVREIVRESARRHGVEHFLCEVDGENYSLLNELVSIGFKIKDFKRTLIIRRGSRVAFSKGYGFIARDFRPDDINPVMAVFANQVFESRYTRDDFFEKEKVCKLYPAWIKGIADMDEARRILKVVERGGEVVAAGGVIEIDFSSLGVDRKIMGNGVSACLPRATGAYMEVIRSIIDDGLRRGWSLFETKVSVNNTAANRVLERIGMSSPTACYSLHLVASNIGDNVLT